MNEFEHMGIMTTEAHKAWIGVLTQLVTMQIAAIRDQQAAVGRGVYRMHTTRSPAKHHRAHD